MTNAKATLFIPVLILAFSPQTKAENEHSFPAIIKLSTGLDYSSGDYGLPQKTNILYLPFNLKYDSFPWIFNLTIPYLQITGPGSITGGIDGGVITTSERQQTRSTESGLGDVVVSATFALGSLGNNLPLIELTGKIKLATADESKGLGTGKNDYLAQLDIAENWGKFTPFATLGYKIMGDTPELDLNNRFITSVGINYRVNPRLNSGFSFDYQQASNDETEDAKELVGYLNYKLNKQWAINGYGVTGFSDGSPDNAVGLQLNYTMD